MTQAGSGWSHPCAGCARWLAPWVTVCPHCGREQPAAPSPSESAEAAAAPPPTPFFDTPAARPDEGDATVADDLPAASPPETREPTVRRSGDDAATARATPVADPEGPTSASEVAVRHLASDRVYCPFCGKHVPNTAAACPRCPPPAEPGAHGRTARCPRCAAGLTSVERDGVPVDVCARCGGLWIDRAHVFRALPLVSHGTGTPAARLPRRENRETIAYVPCVRCGVRMARRLFAPRADLIIDFCLEHGLWIDRAELDHLTAFLAAGGLELARARDEAREHPRSNLGSETPWLDVDSQGGIGKATLGALNRVIRDNGRSGGFPL